MAGSGGGASLWVCDQPGGDGRGPRGSCIEDPQRFSDMVPISGCGSRPANCAGAVFLRRRALGRFRDSMARLFSNHGIDAMLAPTLPTGAVAADRLVIEGTGLEESVGVAWTRLTMPFNATGQPVLAIPCGLDSEACQSESSLAGIPGQETALFQTAMLVERALDFHRSHRPLRGPGRSP